MSHRGSDVPQGSVVYVFAEHGEILHGHEHPLLVLLNRHGLLDLKGCQTARGALHSLVPSEDGF